MYNVAGHFEIVIDIVIPVLPYNTVHFAPWVFSTPTPEVN